MYIQYIAYLKEILCFSAGAGLRVVLPQLPRQVSNQVTRRAQIPGAPA